MKAVLLLSMLVVLLQTEEVRLNRISQSINLKESFYGCCLADAKLSVNNLPIFLGKEERWPLGTGRAQNFVVWMGLPLDIIILLLHLECGLVINPEVDNLPQGVIGIALVYCLNASHGDSLVWIPYSDNCSA